MSKPSWEEAITRSALQGRVRCYTPSHRGLTTLVVSPSDSLPTFNLLAIIAATNGISITMRRVIAAMNVTLDGFCDHTAGIADDELHQHYATLLAGMDVILYGRKTYQLMEYWREVVTNPSGNTSTDTFAHIMNNIQKVVFSRTMKTVDWHSARVAERELRDEVEYLKSAEGSTIGVGSPSLIAQLLDLQLIDELQLCIHPVVLGQGLRFFRNKSKKMPLKLLQTKTFSSGVVQLRYEPIKGDGS